MPDPSPQVYWSFAQGLLDAVVAYYAEVGIALPDTRYVTMPDVAPMDECLVVFAGPIAVGSPGGPAEHVPLKQDWVRKGMLTVACYRATESLRPNEGFAESIFDPQSASDFAQTVMTDMVTILRAVQRAKRTETWGGFSQIVALGLMSPIAISGNLGGCQLPIECEVM